MNIFKNPETSKTLFTEDCGLLGCDLMEFGKQVTNLHGNISEKTILFIFTVMRILNLILYTNNSLSIVIITQLYHDTFLVQVLKYTVLA